MRRAEQLSRRHYSLPCSLIFTTVFLLSACSASVTDNNGSADFAIPENVLLNKVSYASVIALPTDPNRAITLAYAASALQFGRLYLPPATAGKKGKAPLVIFIHGGCWLNAYDIAHSNAFSQALAEQGYAVWSLEYRRTGDEGGGWPGSFTDIQNGIAYAQQALAGYGVDTSRIVLSGHSAGGQLALLAGSKNTSAAIVGVIGLAAITDLTSYAKGTNSCQNATAQFIGGHYDVIPERYQQASAVQQKMHPATLLLQGSADTIVPPEQASHSGMRYKLVENAGHFDWIHPQTTAYKQFVITLQELLPL